MKSINDLPEKLQLAFWKAFEDEFSDFDYPFYHKEVMSHFFAAGYEAAIAERAKFDEQNELIIKDITEL